MTSRWLLLTLLATATAFAGEVYSWTDANGVRHFADSPPPRSTAGVKRLKVQGGITSTETGAEGGQPGAGKAPDTSLAAAAGYSPADITRNCTVARQNLETLEKWKPALKPNGLPVDPQASDSHAAQVEKANAQIRLFCGQPQTP